MLMQISNALTPSIQYVIATSANHLFLNAFGEPLGLSWLSQLIKDYISQADIGKQGSCHLFRHSMATLMLENGADIRYIQMMLGHADLRTTQIYTQVSIAKLKEIHTTTHPAKSGHTRHEDKQTMQTDGTDDFDYAKWQDEKQKQTPDKPEPKTYH